MSDHAKREWSEEKPLMRAKGLKRREKKPENGIGDLNRDELFHR
jgi:hypothetical protein